MSTSGDVESISSSFPISAPGSAPGSPRNKVKFLCSHGGKILPRPSDGHLKYVGGETRVISVPRNIIFTDLMRKLKSLLEGDVVLKYQLIPEDLDALVTVKSDEDLRHMLDEYNRQELIGTPRLRTFLFPANPIIIDNQMGPMDRHSLEQRYINSINGIIVNQTVPMYSNFRPPAINTSQTTFTISSACTSPRTPPETAIPTMAHDGINSDQGAGFRKGSSGSLTRAHSSPSLCNLVGNCSPHATHKNHSPRSTLNLGLTNQQYPYHHQTYRQPPPPPPPQPQPYHPHTHSHPHQHQHQHQHQHHVPHTSPKPPLNPGPEQYLLRQRSSGAPDYYRYSTEHSQHSPHTPNHYPRSSRGSHMAYQRNTAYDEYNGNNRIYHDRESPPGSPLARSPHQNNNYVAKWDPVGGRT
ncbi:hypothetical protein LXL04_016969 [Taraxacum kok-saghyz]